MRYGMVIDLKRCIGCHMCSVACKSNNNLPAGMLWNRVLTIGGEAIDTASGTYPNDLHMSYLPVNCQHCANPPCVAACPTGASYKRAEDGIVLVDSDLCIGCRMCMVACPYNARSFNWKKPEYAVDFALGDADAPEHQFNVVEKCTFCVNRLARGEAPACMELCSGRARYWGDLDDPESEVNKAMQGRQTVQLLEEKGTGPAVFYLK
jgi:molybdopterin-containing oxidoreductase family iron-sulfur binding subunit